MPKRQYESLNLSKGTLEVIDQANGIIETYAAQGYDLTLRQLYYQFVSRDLLPNTQQNYSRLGDIVSKGRRAGLIDWTAIVDRTRTLRSSAHWTSPQEIIDAVAHSFRLDLWRTQPAYVEVWFEKDALMGVFERATGSIRVPYFSCRGYTSDSEMWVAAQRLARQGRRKEEVVVLHFGDHDPSGMDMTRDIRDRLELFGAGDIEVRRLALNMDQVRQYDPPPNPAKESDSRFAAYRDEYGDESWELDALEPSVLAALVGDEVSELVDKDLWAEEELAERTHRAELKAISKKYPQVVKRFCKDLELEEPEDDSGNSWLNDDDDEEEG